MLRNLAAAALALAAVVAGGAAEAAQDLPITAFAGRYVGT